MVEMCIGLHVKYPLILSDFNETCIFDRFPINAQISNSLKIRQLGDELFPADRETDGWRDVTNIVVALRNFANAPKSSILSFVALCDNFLLIPHIQ